MADSVGSASQTNLASQTSTTPIGLIEDGILAGIIGAAVVAIWFLVLDTARGQMFITPSLLGSVIFFGQSPEQVVAVNPYTIKTWMGEGAEIRTSSLSAGIVIFQIAAAGWGVATILRRHRPLIARLNLLAVALFVGAPIAGEIFIRAGILLRSREIRDPVHYADHFSDDEYWKLIYRWFGRHHFEEGLATDPQLGWAPPRTPENPLGVISAVHPATGLIVLAGLGPMANAMSLWAQSPLPGIRLLEQLVLAFVFGAGLRWWRTADSRLREAAALMRNDALRIAMTNVFVASANERVIDGARRLLVNEFEGEELARHLRLESIIPRMPIRTIAVKTRIAEALAAHGLGPVFLR